MKAKMATMAKKYKKAKTTKNSKKFKTTNSNASALFPKGPFNNYVNRILAPPTPSKQSQ